MSKLPLHVLTGNVVELSVLFPGGGHVTVAGRVRLVNETIWVGALCLPMNTEADCRDGVYSVYPSTLIANEEKRRAATA